ncbi:hydrolase [Idiomarina tyrosinivorans]|uniref:Hydrolase n=1 Tax=Idiomarina tyrosinivorans TaxID=1445662 RepID=A0A432ZQL5_9GAMM|nr:hydrolase [Idiomarina tyrosinivorans]RUO80190.1 hydrolase [Idiomarina tyrosinivorans]
MPIIASEFQAAKGFSYSHIQTLLPRVLFRTPPLEGHWQNVTLTDGDFVELYWQAQKPEQQTGPLVVLFHGLEGGAASPYIWQTLQQCQQQGFNALVMHFRGCGRQPLNRLPRAYHSGDTGDALEVLTYLAKRFPTQPIYLAGFSLGGNMLVKLLAEQPKLPIAAAFVACAPLDLWSCSERIDRGFSRIYRRYLLEPLKQKFEQKVAQGIIPADHPLASVSVKSMRSFFQFDDKVTAPLHGFRSVADYYRRASGRPVLGQINVATRILHAADDPFLGPNVVPKVNELSPTTTYEMAKHGGHMGFIERLDGKLHSWLPSAIAQYFRAKENEVSDENTLATA